ncbi:MAG TPA: PorV/PorQ family protein [Saprospiraceae bacterium]|nr:PorV/PorQ family protein [Saprospiraceae bacterium]
MKKAFRIGLFILCLSNLYAQAPKFSNDFLNIGVGARGMGMGSAVVASVKSINAAYWNPAALSLVPVKFQVGAQHAEWFSGVGNYDYLAFGKSMGEESKSFGSISLIRMGIDNIPNTLRLRAPDGSIDYSRIETFSVADYALLGSYARKFKSDKIHIGANAKVIHRSFGSFAKAWGFGVDLGLHMQLSQKIQLGVMARDITTTFNAYKFGFTDEQEAVLLQTNNSIPSSSVEYTLPKLIGALAYEHSFSEKLVLISEIDIEFSNNSSGSNLIGAKNFTADPRIGFELGISKKVNIRLGANNFQSVLKDDGSGKKQFSFYPTAGLGIQLKRVSIDYAMTNIANAGVGLYSHFISLNLNF